MEKRLYFNYVSEGRVCNVREVRPTVGMTAGTGSMLILSTHKAEREQEGSKGPHQ